MREHFIPTTLPAGEFLQRAGDVARTPPLSPAAACAATSSTRTARNTSSSSRPETWWLADGASLMTGTPSQYFVDAVEDSELLLIDPPSHQPIVDHVPGYAAAFRTGLQKHTAAKDQRIVTALSTTAEERYLEFLERYPSLAQRVPQWMLASYLGVSPETVSRIRKHLSRSAARATRLSATRIRRGDVRASYAIQPVIAVAARRSRGREARTCARSRRARTARPARDTRSARPPRPSSIDDALEEAAAIGPAADPIDSSPSTLDDFLGGVRCSSA